MHKRKQITDAKKIFVKRKGVHLIEFVLTIASSSSCSRVGLAHFMTFQPSFVDMAMKSFTIIRIQNKESGGALQFLGS